MKKYFFIMLGVLLFATTVFARYDINISKVPNGTYQGQVKEKSDVYRVNVTVRNGKIQKIDLVTKVNNATQKEASNAFALMIRQNKIDVGSKVSSTWKALVYDALDQPNKGKK